MCAAIDRAPIAKSLPGVAIAAHWLVIVDRLMTQLFAKSSVIHLSKAGGSIHRQHERGRQRAATDAKYA